MMGAAALGAMWVARRRDLYRRGSTPLSGEARALLSGFFGPDLLRRTEVARVERIAGPLPGSLARWRPSGMLDLSTVRGMAFIDTIAIASANIHVCDDCMSLLFHVLVHVTQYHVLGTSSFVDEYLRGWLHSERRYHDNPMEVMAYELQQRFDLARAVPFSVEAEVQRRLAPM